MNNIFYIIGVVVVVLFIAGYFGLRKLRVGLNDSRFSSFVRDRNVPFSGGCGKCFLYVGTLILMNSLKIYCF